MGGAFSAGEISQQPALRNIPAEFDICRIHLEGYHEPVFASSTGLFGILQSSLYTLETLTTPRERVKKKPGYIFCSILMVPSLLPLDHL